MRPRAGKGVNEAKLVLSMTLNVLHELSKKMAFLLFVSVGMA